MIISTESHLLCLSFLPLSPLDDQVILAKEKGGGKKQIMSISDFLFFHTSYK